MVKLDELLEDFAALPQDAQQQVADFIAFLRLRYKLSVPSTAMDRDELADESFIGIWKERKDMQNSGQWVREVRKNEWAQ